MTTIRVPVAEMLLAERETWAPVQGLQFLSADGPWLASPSATICSFEDDGAPPDLAGRLVELTLRTAGDGTVSIIERTIIE